MGGLTWVCCVRTYATEGWEETFAFSLVLVSGLLCKAKPKWRCVLNGGGMCINILFVLPVLSVGNRHWCWDSLNNILKFLLLWRQGRPYPSRKMGWNLSLPVRPWYRSLRCEVRCWILGLVKCMCGHCNAMAGNTTLFWKIRKKWIVLQGYNCLSMPVGPVGYLAAWVNAGSGLKKHPIFLIRQVCWLSLPKDFRSVPVSFSWFINRRRVVLFRKMCASVETKQGFFFWHCLKECGWAVQCCCCTSVCLLYFACNGLPSHSWHERHSGQATFTTQNTEKVSLFTAVHRTLHITTVLIHMFAFVSSLESAINIFFFPPLFKQTVDLSVPVLLNFNTA